MERLSSRKPVFKVPDVSLTDSVETKNIMNTVSKWVPLICAGSAIGVSIFALKEIKNVRKELVTVKKDQIGGGSNEKLEKKMEYMEQQLKTISEYLKKSNQQNHVNSIRKSNRQSSGIIKNVVPLQQVPDEVKIINETEDDNTNDPDEYEEVEVTDDET